MKMANASRSMTKQFRMSRRSDSYSQYMTDDMEDDSVMECMADLGNVEVDVGDCLEYFDDFYHHNSKHV